MTHLAPYSHTGFSGHVSYDEMGSGEPFVLVHGTTGDRNTFAQISPTIAEKFRVIQPEYSGSGTTTDNGDPLTPELLAAQILAVCDHLGVDTFHLAGYSLGAVAAVTLAAIAPSRVRSLTSINGWARTDERMKFTFALWQDWLANDRTTFAKYAMADGLSRESFELFTAAGVAGLVPITANSLAPGSDRQAELDARVDIAHLLAAITAPTLVIGGVTDRWVDCVHSESMATAICDARLVRLDCGHLSVTEKATEVAQLLLEHATAAPGHATA